MFPVILFLFIVVPLVEIFVLIQVGQVIGGLNTILLLIVTAVVGASLVKSQGLRAWSLAQQRMAMGEMPGQQLAEGMIIFMAGVMFVTPGFLTDIVALVFLLPGFRQALARKLMQRMQVHTVQGHHSMHGSFRSGPRGPGEEPRGGRTFEGEYKDEENERDRIDRDDRQDK